MTRIIKLKNFEIRSKEEINGWPLIHINIGTNPETGRPLVAKGLVAIGNIAFGVVSIGVAAFGVVTLAVFGLGVVSMASLAIGIVAIGAVALGYEYAIGAVVRSVETAIGPVSLDFQFLAWSLLFTASIALIIWGMEKIKAARSQS
jgi:hypothetical protein